MTIARTLYGLAIAMLAFGSSPASAFDPGVVDTPYASVGLDANHAGLSDGNEEVDLFSGALNLSYVDHEIPGSWGLPLRVVRSYSSKVLNESFVPNEESWVGLGWELHFGRYKEDATAGANYKWIELPGRGVERAYWLDSTQSLYRTASAANAFPAQYSSSNELWVTTGFNFMYRSGLTEYSVITPDGVVYVFDTSHGTASDGWTYCTEMYNAWGGDIAITYNTGTGVKPGAISSVTDAEGHGVTFAVDGSGYLDSMSYTTASGGTGTVDYTVGTTDTAHVLTSVARPTGETTAYAYNTDYDELETVTLPTGGTTTYSFSTIFFLWHVNASHIALTYPTRVLDTKVVSDGTTSNTWTYDFPDYDYHPETELRTTTVTLPTGGVIDHTFYCYSSYFDGAIQYQAPQYIIGKPASTEWFDSSTDTVPRKYTITSWDGSGDEGNYVDLVDNVGEDPFVLSTLNARVVVPQYTAVLNDPTSDSDLMLYSYFGYAEDTYDAYGNPLSQNDQTHSAYSGYGYVTYRRTQHTYAWADATDGPTLSGWNLVHLPATETMGYITTPYATSIATTFRNVGWTYETAGGFEGLIASYDSSTYPAANTSSAEYRDYTWSADTTNHLLKVSVDLGGLRQERRNWQYGTLEHEGFLKGSTMVWTLDRDVNAATGLVTREANGNGDHTDYTWDADGRLSTITPAVDDPTTVTYALTATPPTVTMDNTAAAGGTITYTYDAFGRLVTTDQPNGTGVTTTTETEWDSLGRAARTYLPYESTPGSYVDTSFDVLDRPTDVDRFNAATSTTDSSTFDYDHLQVTAVNARSYTTVTDADGDGTLRKTTAAAGANIKGANTFSDGTRNLGDYDVLLNAAGTATLGYQARYLDGENRLWKFYDTQSGARTRVRNAAGDVGYQYDSLSHYTHYATAYNGQLSAVYFTTSSTTPTGTPAIGFFRDGDSMGSVPSGWTYTNPVGNLTGIRDQAALEQLAYDDQNRLSASRRTFTDFGQVQVRQDYTRNDAGDIESIVLKWSPTRYVTTTYSYGEGDKVEGISVAVTNPSGGSTTTTTTTVLSAATYQPDGGYASLAFGNGVTQYRDVDGLSRTEAIYTTGASTNLDLSMTWDANDNLASVTDSGGTDTYTYDTIDRLTGVSYEGGSASESYTWDEAGNMTNRSGLASTAFAATRSFTTYPTTTTSNHNTATGWTYNSVGNLTADGTGANTYGYDYRGLVTSDSDGTNSATIIYDHAGRRSVRAVTLGAASPLYDIYVYDVLGRLAARYMATSLTSTPLAQEVFVYLGNTPVAVVDYTPAAPNGRVEWLHADHMGTQRMVTGSTGATVGTQEMLPFGILRSTTGDMAQNDVSYAGHEQFDTFDVADFGARSYHSTTSAFVSPDLVALGSLNDPMSFNRYSYARGNPMTYVDPNGHMPWAAAALVVYGVVDEALTLTDIGMTAYAYSQGDPDTLAMAMATTGAAEVPFFPNGESTFYYGKKIAPRVMTAIEEHWKAAQAIVEEAEVAGVAGGERAYMSFTKKGKAEIDAENAAAHGGVNVCESCGQTVVPGQRSQRGVSPPGNERQRDHIYARSRGGDGAPPNGQVLCRDCNIAKSDKTP